MQSRDGSIQQLDYCHLCLQASIDPVVCLKGHLTCKECIFKNLLSQKQLAKQTEATERKRELELQHSKKNSELQQKQHEITRFCRTEESLGSNVPEESMLKSQTPKENPAHLTKSSLKCPFEPHPVSIKTLFPVKFKYYLGSNSKPICFVCLRELQFCCVCYLKCGHVVCKNCSESKEFVVQQVGRCCPGCQSATNSVVLVGGKKSAIVCKEKEGY